MAASKNLRPSGLELGGKSALIVFGDAEVDKAVEWAMVSIRDRATSRQSPIHMIKALTITKSVISP